jgi:hypothetical protein
MKYQDGGAFRRALEDPLRAKSLKFTGRLAPSGVMLKLGYGRVGGVAGLGRAPEMQLAVSLRG